MSRLFWLVNCVLASALGRVLYYYYDWLTWLAVAAFVGMVYVAMGSEGSEGSAEGVLGYDCAKQRPRPRIALVDHLLWSLLTWGAAITLAFLWCAFLLVDDETTTFGPAYAPYARV
jgi:hypothetical protein